MREEKSTFECSWSCAVKSDCNILLTPQDEEEIYNRFTMLQYNFLIRILKSFKKFAAQVLSAIPLIYEKESDWEKLYSKLCWATEKNNFRKWEMKDFVRFVIVEGFICEGKSTFINNEYGFDSEYDDFWRCPLKGDADDEEIFLEHKYYPIFILCGIASSINYALSENKQVLYLDRAWGSLNLWSKQNKVIGSHDTDSEIQDNIFTQTFYASLFSLLSKPNQKHKFVVDILLLSRFPTAPKDWIEKRYLERLLYGDNPSNSVLYYKIAYEFLFNLSRLYSTDKTILVLYSADSQVKFY